jgi:hypothetical protein
MDRIAVVIDLFAYVRIIGSTGFQELGDIAQRRSIIMKLERLIVTCLSELQRHELIATNFAIFCTCWRSGCRLEWKVIASEVVPCQLSALTLVLRLDPLNFVVNKLLSEAPSIWVLLLRHVSYGC